ncbi:MAG TPA: PAS domain-containing protein [Gemmatimonadales bacterium]|nr:PAS domain-containing protein [Gemmatimonadales bacterium]
MPHDPSGSHPKSTSRGDSFRPENAQPRPTAHPDDRPLTSAGPPRPHDDLTAAARVQLLVEQIQDFAIFMLTPDGRHATWNPGVERVLGYDEATFLGRPAELIFTPEDVARGVPAAELATAREHGAANDDRWMRRRDETHFWASGVTTAVRDEAGRLLGFGKVLRDLTHERLLMERLAESEDRLRLAIAAAKVGTWRLDLRTGTDTLDANLAHLLELGEGDTTVTLEQFFGRVHPEDRDRTRAAFRNAVEQRAPLEVEFRIVCHDGSARWLRDHGEVLLDEAGEPRYLTGAVVDITRQRDADERLQASQRMDAVGKLAGGVAHEVNNMMSVVLGFTDIVLADFPPGDRRRRDLERVRTAAGRAATVTAQLLAFSRQQMLQPTLLRPADIVMTLEPMLRRLLGPDRELVLDLAPDAGHVLADRGQLEQVLINLALNARDAMGQGGRLTVEVQAIVLDTTFTARHLETSGLTGPCVMLVVSDTGHGMDDATRARVFEPFFTTKPTGQGTGLGLAVVHGIIHQTGGYIGVQSEPGAGTTFRIYLPRVTETGTRPPAQAVSRASPAVAETILIVEDELMVRQLVVRLLERLGYRCLQAADGVEGLRTLEAHQGEVGAVVCDLVMPHMNGREMAERLAILRPGLPVLFMSGYTDDEMIRRNLLAPDAPFIQKPFDVDAFGEKMRALLAAGTSQSGEGQAAR